MKQIFNSPLVPRILYWIILFVIGLFGLEAIIYPQLIENLISLQVEIIALLSLVVLSLTISAYQYSPHKRFIIIISLATFLISIISIVFYYFEKMMYPNIIFSTLHLHPSVIKEIALYLWAVWSVLSLPMIWKRQANYLFLAPPIGFLFLVFIRFTYVYSFIEIGVENGLVEWLTFIFCVITSFMAARYSIRYWKAKQYSIFCILAAIAVGSLILAGEEIAWGEFVLQFTTHDFFLTHNVQQETTLHNLGPVQQVMWYGYILIGFLGGILPFYKTQLQKIWSLFSLLPVRRLTTYFLPLLIYGLNRSILGPIYYKTWEESVELVFSAGILLYVLNFASTKKPKKHQQNSLKSIKFISK